MTGLEIVLLVVLVVAFAAFAGYAWRQIARLRARVAEAEGSFTRLCEELSSAPFDLTQTLGDGERKLITVEILNPLEVAGEQSALVRRFGAVAPAMLRAEVTRRAVKELQAQLAEQGVEAEVRVHDAV